MLIQQLLGSKNKQIWVILHWHSSESPYIVICPGLALFKAGAYFVLSALARRCYERGMNVIQFDYFGEGDSAGTFEDVTITSMTESTQVVMEFIKNLGCTRVGIVGYGAGNILACYVGQELKVDALALLLPQWDAILGFCELFSSDELAVGNARGHLGVDISPSPKGKFWRAIVGITPWAHYYPVNIECLYELERLNPHEQLLQFFKPCLLVWEDEQLPSFLNTIARREWVQSVQVPGISQMCFDDEQPFWPQRWDEIAIQTSSWLHAKMAGGTSSVSARGTSKLLLPGSNDNCAEDNSTNVYPFDFNCGQQRVLGVLHAPSLRAKGKHPCVIYVPGLGGERVDVNRCGPRLGKALTDRGFCLLRYDSRGSGVSEGEFFETTWSGRLDELRCALKQLAHIDRVDMSRIALLSYSAGAKLACLAANLLESIQGCVLWSPDLVASSSIERGGRSSRFYRHSSGKLVTPHHGYWLGMDFFTDSRKYSFPIEFEECQKPMLIIFADKESNLMSRRFIEKAVSGRQERTISEVSGLHLFSYEKLDQVIEISVEWLTGLFD